MKIHCEICIIIIIIILVVVVVTDWCQVIDNEPEEKDHH